MKHLRCLRCLLLVMYTHPFAKKALTLHLAHSEGHERYFSCNLMHRKVLASSHQHLMAEAPQCASCYAPPAERGFRVHENAAPLKLVRLCIDDKSIIQVSAFMRTRPH